MAQSPQLRKVHGRVVQPIAPDKAIEHTAHHFFDPSEGWEGLPPAKTPGPTHFLAEARLDASSLPSVSRSRQNAAHREANLERWLSEGALCSLAREAHAKGYYPRYALLVERAGRLPGGAWQLDEKGHRTDWKGYRVAVRLSPDGESLRVKTAYFSGVLREGASLTSKPLAELLKAYCQPPEGEGSSSGRKSS